MNVTDIKTQMHMQEWAKLIEARQGSGLSIKQWCQQSNVPVCLNLNITTIFENCG